MWDYTKEVMEHYRNPKNVGKIDDADAIGEAGSLACGDALKIYLKIKDNVVTDAKFQTFGCGSAVASSSVLTEMIIGKPLEEVRKITNKDIADKLGGLPPEKMHCSVMGYEALENALSIYFHEDVQPSSKDKLICKCFSVTEKQIINAVKENNLKTVDEVTNYTKAGGACGHCKKSIQGILNKIHGEKHPEEKPKLTQTQKILKINSIIENQISPELRKDNGDIELIDIEGDKVYVKLRGSCSGCKNSTLTLKSFVEATLRATLGDEIEVIEVGK